MVNGSGEPHPRTADQEPSDGEPGTGVRAIDRVAAILRCFDARRPALGISTLARLTGLTTSTTHRLLVAMQTNELVRRREDRRFELGPLLVRLARNGALPATFEAAARPAMHRLRDEFDETVGLHELLPSGERVVVEQVESHQELRRTYTEFGVPLPLTVGGPSKAMLACLPADVQRARLRGRVPPATPATITDPAALRRDLAATRARGYAISLAERIQGIHTVAAPIFGDGARVLGALSVSGPAVRMPDDRLREIGERVAAEARGISETLGADSRQVAAAVDAAGEASA